MNSFRAGTAAFLWFFGGLLCFALADWSDWHRSDLTPFPLPPPGLQVKEPAYIESTGDYAIWVDVASQYAAASPGSQPDIKCRFQSSLIPEVGPPTMIQTSSLQPAATYAAGQTVAYATQSFRLRKGRYSIWILNKGCDSGQFPGGSAYLYHYKPVTLPLSFVVRVLAYVFMAAGISAFLSERRERREARGRSELEIRPTIA
jgi:hypothetical protein